MSWIAGGADSADPGGADFEAWRQLGEIRAAAVVEEADMRAWNESIAAAREAETSFGACNFMTYSAIVPG